MGGSVKFEESLAARLGLMKPTAFIVNTARAQIMDRDALVQALNEKKIAGAAVDVFEPEPPPADHPWLHTPRLYVTPHLGGTSREAIMRIGQAIAAVAASLEGAHGQQHGNQALQQAQG